MTHYTIDPVELTQRLIRCPSITPKEGGALDLLQEDLSQMGFDCHRLYFEEDGTEPVDNLFARIGTKGPVLGFAGHTDVVPVGDESAWDLDPFAAEMRDGAVWGRGASDMKGAIAAFVSATQHFLASHGPDFDGSIALVITGDEEGPAINGTVKMLDWMRTHNHILDVCVVGEPTNPDKMGDMIKIGRRGSINGWLSVDGVQGHVAYPHLADNPLPRLVGLLHTLAQAPLDEGTPHFPASTLALTDIHVGNPASNVIPANGTARFNIRFNDLHTGQGLITWLHEQLSAANLGNYTLKTKISGEAFLTPPGPLSELVAHAVQDVTGRSPDLSTTGGTSDARFIKDMCPVIECGLINKTIHKVNEHAQTRDIIDLTAIYTNILNGYFTKPAEPS